MEPQCARWHFFFWTAFCSKQNNKTHTLGIIPTWHYGLCRCNSRALCKLNDSFMLMFFLCQCYPVVSRLMSTCCSFSQLGFSCFFFSASVIVVYLQSSHKEILCSKMKVRVKNGHLSTAENRPKYNLLPNFMGTAPNQPFLLLFHRKHNYLLTK